MNYEDYIAGVKSGKIVVGRYIKLVVQRFEEFRAREDIVFDKEKVERVIAFIAQMKHYLGKFAGQPFILQPWQEFIVAVLFGLRYKDSGLRVVRNAYIQMARKQGKTAFTAAIQLALMLIDGEAAPEIAYVANTREQARILLDITQEFTKSLDPKGKSLKLYKNSISCPTNKGVIKIYSADSSKLDGLNLSSYAYDEFHEATNRKLLDVLASSQGMRTEPLGLIITTAGFSLVSPCKALYDLHIKILEGVAKDDSNWGFLYCMDLNDDWQDEKNWIKSNPNLDITVTREFIRGEIQKAKNDSSAMVGVKTKTLNIWCQSQETWIEQEYLVKSMKPLPLEEFRGLNCILGLDLASVSDFTALSMLIPVEDHYYFKNWTFLPRASMEGHSNAELYKRFADEGTMAVTPGNVTDFNYIAAKIEEINTICPITAIMYDNWQSSMLIIELTQRGYHCIPVRQSIGYFSCPTMEMERLVKSGKITFEQSMSILWQFANVVLRRDAQDNIKPDKEVNRNKIDSVIASIMALSYTIKNISNNDFSIISS